MPAARIVLDHAGFDTDDSCVRAREVFGVRRAIVVAHADHLPRAVALCRAVGVDADGVGTPPGGTVTRGAAERSARCRRR